MTDAEHESVLDHESAEYVAGRGARRAHERLWQRADIYHPKNDHLRPTAAKMDRFGRLPSSKAFAGRP